MNATNMNDYLATQANGLSAAQVASAGFQTDITTGKAVASSQGLPADPDDDTLWNTMDPETGRRFLIPFLPVSDPLYRQTYTELMRKRHRDPAQFSRTVLMRDGK